MVDKLVSVRNDTENRYKDVKNMLNILDKNEKVEQQLILKSSLILMIYNIVEGTMSNLLTEFFDVIVVKRKSIDELPNKLQKTIYTYYLRKIGNSQKSLREFRGNDGISLCNISYLDMSKYMKLFSGNLDSKRIREISEKLGICLPEAIDEPVLLKVKNIRNKLAHGETKFCNACQDITLDEMNKLCKKVKVYLNNVTDEYEHFLNRI